MMTRRAISSRIIQAAALVLFMIIAAGFFSVKAYAEEGAADVINFDFKGFSGPTVQYSPSETGYYRIDAEFTNDPEYEAVDFKISCDGVFIGGNQIDADYRSLEGGTLYAEAGKTYQFKLSKSNSFETAGALYLTQLSQDEVDEMFDISGTVLEGYSGDLINIMIPEGITDIDCYEDIQECSLGKDFSIFFPSTLESISVYGLNNNSSLYSDTVEACYFDIPDACENYASLDGVIYDKSFTELIAAPSELNIQELVIPENVTSIGSYAFARGGVHKIVAPESLETIEEFAFYFAGGLSEIELGSGLTTIEQYAFTRSGLVSVTIPSNVEIVDENAFQGAKSLEEVTFENKSGLVRAGAFSGCRNLSKININADVLIAEDAFQWCPAISDISVGGDAAEWEVRDGCLVNLYDQSNHPSIDPDDAFAFGADRWNRLVLVPYNYPDSSYTVDDDIDQIDYQAFDYSSDVNSFGTDPEYSVREVTLGSNTVRLTINCNLEAINVSAGNEGYFAKEGVLYTYYDYDPMYDDPDDRDKTKTVLVKYPIRSSAKEFKVPDSVKEIGSYAFYNAEYSYKHSLTKVYIPASTEMESSWGGIFPSNSYTEDGQTMTIAGYKNSPAYEYYLENGDSEGLVWETLAGNEIVIKFNPNGGKVKKKHMTIEKGKAIGNLPVPTYKGKIFLGWFTAKSSGTKISENTKPTGNKTYYAHWAKPDFKKVKFKLDKTSYTWNGKAKKPNVIATFKGVTLKKGTDYTVSYAKNVEPGTGKVTVKGKGLFKAKKAKTLKFKINKADQVISAGGISYKKDTKPGIKKIKISAKEKPTFKLSSNNIKVVAITTKKADKKKGNIRLVSPGEATITIKSSATKHYKAGTKKIIIYYMGDQKISLEGNSWLTYDKTTGKYTMSGDAFSQLIEVKRAGGVPYKCTIEQSGRNNEVWVDEENKLTAKGSGEFLLKVTTEKTDLLESVTEVFTIYKEGFPLTDAKYQYKQTGKDTLTLVVYNGTEDDVLVPDQLSIADRNIKVTGIGDGLYQGKDIQTVKCRDTSPVTTIGKNAFNSCSKLTSVRLAPGVVNIGAGAFSDCVKLNKIELTPFIKVIGKDTFKNCASLEGVMYLPYSLTEIGENAFSGCKKIERLMIYSYLRQAANNAFLGCSGVKDVYYSSAEYRWKGIKWGTGNQSVTGATIHFNCGADEASYSYVDIDEETLYTDYPEYLTNQGYEDVTGMLEDEMLQILINTSDIEIGVSAMKSQLASAPTLTLMSFIDKIYHEQSGEDTTWTEEKINKAFALKLIEDVKADPSLDYLMVLDDMEEFTSTVNEFRDYGSKIFLDGKTRDQLAAALDGMIEGRSKKDIQDTLKKISEYWDDEGKSPERPWSTSEVIETATGEAADAADFFITVVMLNESYRKYVNTLLEELPEGSGLYQGMTQLQNMMDRPLLTYTTDLLEEKGIKIIAKTCVKKYWQHVGMGTAMVATLDVFFKAAAFMMDVPTIDDYSKAWISTVNTRVLHDVMLDLNERCVANKGSTDWDLQYRHELITCMYFSSLKMAGDYVGGLKEETTYIKQRMDRYRTGFSYPGYITACKQNLADALN